MSNDLQRWVAEGPLTQFQLLAIGVCVCLNMLDGFDILTMSFAASGVKTDWHLAGWTPAHLYGLFAVPWLSSVAGNRILIGAENAITECPKRRTVP